MAERMKFRGRVKKGSGRGRGLGFPTANIELQIEVSDGIYVGTVGRAELPALIFIGIPKTFNETIRRAEVYILDFNEDIYGEEIEVTLMQKIRENQKFDSVDKLIEQMKIDEKTARFFFATIN